MAIAGDSIVAIGGYFINGYWWLLVVIDDYCIINHCWIFYVIIL
jgi:hypothetical protein